MEELHLKSLTVNKTSSSQIRPSNSNLGAIPPAQRVLIPNEQINQQEIDLDLFVNKLEEFDVEDDSD